MSGLYTVAATVCACCIITALLSRFVTDGGTKKILSLVIGAFILCCMLAPAARAIGGIKADLYSAQTAEDEISTADEAYNRQILAQTKENLETALGDILSQNGYEISGAEITLALADGNRVIISSITVTIGEEQAENREEIADITEKNFTVRPRVITE